MTCYMFPGQGAQKNGMGESLFNEFPELTKTADDILGYSIRSLCVDDTDGLLNKTEYTQPALYCVNALSFRQQQNKNANQASYFIGHSLGEYNALEASGALNFEDGLRLVKKRGELMGRVANGAMLALLRIDVEKIEQILKQFSLVDIDIANYNTPSQTVISGPKHSIDKAQSIFEEQGAYALPLKTSGAFHSRYMEEAKKEFAEYIKKFTFNQLNTPVISNTHARPYERSEIASTLSQQITHPVRWVESVRYLLQQGEHDFYELGDGSAILSRMITDIKKDYEDKVEAKLKHAHTSVSGSSSKTLRADELAKTKEQISQWNATYTVGTKVKVVGYDKIMRTRSEAIILFGFRSAIYLEGYNGYFALADVKAVNEGVSV